MSRRNGQGGGGNGKHGGRDMNNQGDEEGGHQEMSEGRNPPPDGNLALVERPDQAEELHPFTTNVMRAVMPENKVFPSVEKYGGLTDPVKHLRSFVDATEVYSRDELV